VNDALVMGGTERRAQLLDDSGNQVGSQLARAGGEGGERLAIGPLEGEVIQSFFLAEGVRLDDIGMIDPGTVLGFAQESLDGNRVLAHSGSQDFDGGDPFFGVFRTVDRGGSTLSNVVEKAIARDVSAGQILLRHKRGKVLAI
jgi:hypothetical protein